MTTITAERAREIMQKMCESCQYNEVCNRDDKGCQLAANDIAEEEQK